MKPWTSAWIGWRRMTQPGSSAPTLMEITDAVSQERSVLTTALVEAFVERRHGHFLAQEEAACPKCERLPAGAAVALAHGGDAPGAGDLGASLFLLRGLSPRVLSAGRGFGPVGAPQAGGRAAGRGPAGAGDAPPARLEAVGPSHRCVHERLRDSPSAATDRVVGRAAGVSGGRRYPGSHRPSRRRPQVAADRGVGHRRSRRAQPSRDRQRDPSRAQEEPGSAKALAGGIPRSQGLSLLPGRRRPHRAADLLAPDGRRTGLRGGLAPGQGGGADPGGSGASVCHRRWRPVDLEVGGRAVPGRPSDPRLLPLQPLLARGGRGPIRRRWRARPPLAGSDAGAPVLRGRRRAWSGVCSACSRPRTRPKRRSARP